MITCEGSQCEKHGDIKEVNLIRLIWSWVNTTRNGTLHETGYLVITYTTYFIEIYTIYQLELKNTRTENSTPFGRRPLMTRFFLLSISILDLGLTSNLDSNQLGSNLVGLESTGLLYICPLFTQNIRWFKPYQTMCRNITYVVWLRRKVRKTSHVEVRGTPRNL